VTSFVVDAGPLIALFDRDDRYHHRAVDFVRNCRARLITNLAVLTEATFLLRFSVEAQCDLLRWAYKSLEIDQGTSADLPRIITLIEKYRDMPADFADVSLVALAERLGVSHVASVDSDFAIYRLSDKRPLKNVFLRLE
jgi:predicted nucleic acid-binding protein